MTTRCNVPAIPLALASLLALAGLAPAATPANPAATSSATEPIPTGIQARPLPDGLDTADLYGGAVAVNDQAGLLAVGAPGADAEGVASAGVAHVFERASGEWRHLALLTAPNPTRDGSFGATVALDAGTLAVGAPDTDAGSREDAGIVTVYRTDQLGQDPDPRLLTPPSDLDAGLFGNSVDLDGDRLAVGDNGAGNVYLYQELGGSWTRETVFGRDGPRPSGAFGATGTVALDDGLLAAGAQRYSQDLPDNAGAAFLYVHDPGNDTWTHAQTLTAPSPEAFGLFGVLALDGETLAVGEPGAGIDETGRVHAYEPETANRTNWTHQAALAPERVDGRLGNAVEASGDTILAGAPRERANLRAGGDERETGAAYWIQEQANGTWEQVDRLRAPVPNPENVAGNRFARSLALDNGSAAAGSLGVAGHPETTDRSFLDVDPPINGTGRVTVFGPDPDRDHLATSREQAAGTPPEDPDPDGDGLADGFEVVRWLSDPFDPDTDNDTLTDGTEARNAKTQTLDPDTDGDGFSDAIEHEGLTVEDTRILGPSDPSDHDSIPAPRGSANVFTPFDYDRGDVSPTPPADQPNHWPDFARDQLSAIAGP